jgi:hypothetical protein
MSTQPPLPPTPYVPPPVAPQTVVITDIDMSIGAMCRFMVKWVIAAIPAAIIIWVLIAIVGIIIATIFGGVIHGIFGAPQNHF